MGWKIYFWFITLIMIAGTGLSMAESLGIILPDEGNERMVWMWWEWLYLPILGISITGIFGYAHKKQIGEKQFWKKFFIFLLIVDSLYTVYEDNIGLFNPEEMWRPAIVFPLLIAMFLPYYIALYLYGYKSDSLWDSQPTPEQ